MYTRILRFAPSPNGYLHLGHAYSALLNHDMARDLGGRLLLRIEDIDVSRCRPQYEAAIYQDLGWLGISWDTSVRRQSEQFDDYRAALAKLEAQGLIYPSFESRSEIAALVAARDRQGHWPRDPDGVPLYPGDARQLPAAERERRRRAGEPYALRLALDAAMARTGVLTWTETGSGPQGQTGVVEAAPQMWGDVVLARKEVPASYHLAVAVDDARQGVTDVVGRTRFPSGRPAFIGCCRRCSACRSRWTASQAGCATPTAASCRNRRKQTSLRELRAAGATAVDIRRIVRLVRENLRAECISFLPPSWHVQGLGMIRKNGTRFSERDHAPANNARRRGLPWRDEKRRGVRSKKPAGKPARRRRRRRAPPVRVSEASLAAYAHDIRTALTGILALGELLASSNLGERERRWAFSIKGSAEHLAALTS